MAPLGTLNWLLAGLLAAGLAVAAWNLLRRKSLLLSGGLGILQAAALWAVFGLPAAQVPLAVLGAGVLGGALALVLARTPAASALFMMATFLCLAGVYLALGFPFLAMVQVLLYTGAVVVLFLFVVMLVDLGRAGRTPLSDLRPGLVAPILAGGLAGVALVAVLAAGRVEGAVDPAALPALAPKAAAAAGGGGGFAQELFTRYLLPFEAVTLLMLAALVGVIVLARRPGPGPGKEE